MSRIADIARDFAGRGGKRLRPRLCQAVFDACGGKGDLSPVCEAVECFHKASLVHDDIQDGDETRYGRPTVWKEHGVPVAIAAGDWLVAHGVPFREAYGIAAGLVHAGTPLEDVSMEEYKKACPVFDESIYDAVNLDNCVKRRNLPVQQQLDYLERFINE